MKRLFIFVSFGFAAVILESTLLSGLPTNSIHFDLVLLAIITLSLFEHQKGAILSVAALGFLMDTASVAPFGLSIFSYLIVYGFIRLVFARIMVEVWVARFIWIMIASVLNKIATSLLLISWYGNFPALDVILYNAPLQALFDALLGLVFVPMLRQFDALTIEKLFRPKGLVLR